VEEGCALSVRGQRLRFPRCGIERIRLERKRFITIEWPALSRDALSLYARGLSKPLWCHRRETRRLRSSGASKSNRARAFARAFHLHRSLAADLRRRRWTKKGAAILNSLFFGPP